MGILTTVAGLFSNQHRQAKGIISVLQLTIGKKKKKNNTTTQQEMSLCIWQVSQNAVQIANPASAETTSSTGVLHSLEIKLRTT